VTAWQFVIGGVLLLMIAIATEDLSATRWTTSFVSGLAYLTLVGTALTFLLWFRLLQDSEVSRLSTYNFLVPVFGVALGVLLLGEVIRWMTGIGVLLVLVGVLVVSLRARPAQLSQSAGMTAGRAKP
jgi:probable blue pigment (indigoidine) exporter